MEVLGAISSVITIIDTTGKLISYYGEVKNAGQDATRLQKSLENHRVAAEGLQALLESQDGRLETTQKLRSALDGSLRQLQSVSTTLQEGIDKRNQPSGSGMRDKLRQKMSRLGLDRQSLEWPFQRKEIDVIVNDLHQCQGVLSAALQIDSTAAASMAHQRNVLSRLPIASGAAIDSQANERDPRCHPDTRKEILSRIFSWSEDPDGRCIFWLFGMAGTGKSTICRTVADQLRQKGIPVATYLFKKGEGDRGTAKRFFTTLAAQIVYQVPCIAYQVQDAIEKDPFLADKSKKEQFERLILKPLEECKSIPDLPQAITVVVDALDECDQDEDARAIIRLFSMAKESLTSVRLRFFVTSRPDIHIRLGFKSIGDRYADFALHEIPKPDIEGDIRRFLQWKLSIIRDEFNAAASSDWLASDWPNAESMERLVGLAVPLFIFAATACRFIADVNHGDPSERLEKLLASQRSHDLPRLHATYLPILDQLLLERTDSGWTRRAQEEEQHIIQTFRALIGPIVVLAEPLSRGSLAKLFHTPQRILDWQLSGLHSVLNIPQNESSPVQLLHLSFRDFLVNSANQKNNPFWVDEQETQAALGSHCLSLLSAPGILKNDICGLQQPGKFRSDLDPEVIGRCLQPEVQYACRYWVFHMKQGQCHVRDGGQVHHFLTKHFLHWIEVLSLIGRASESVAMVDDLLALLDNENSASVSSFLRDARRAALRDRRLWDEYPLQIYHSTLVFLPEKSIIRKVFESQYPSYLEQQPRVDTDWDLQLQSFETGKDHTEGMFLFSPNSRLLCWASGKTTEIWDVMAGAPVMRAPGVLQAKVAFSSDGRTLVRAGQQWDGTREVAIFEVATGTCLETIKTIGVSKSIDISSDGKWLAVAKVPDENELETGSSDSDSFDNAAAATDIQLYDLSTAEWGPTLHILGHFEQMAVFSAKEGPQLALQSQTDLTIWDVTTRSRVSSLKLRNQGELEFTCFPFAFSPDGRQLAAFDRLLNVKTGQFEKKLNSSETGQALRFSPDGRQLFNFHCRKDFATVWDVQTGQQLGTFRHFARAIPAISPDGTLLAALAEDRAVLNIWSLEGRDSPAGSKDAIHETFSSIVADPSGNRLACFGHAKSVAKIYNTETWDVEEVVDVCLGPVQNAVFSPDGSLLAFFPRFGGPRRFESLDQDITRYLGAVWDVEAGEKVVEFDSMGCLALSSDGARLAIAGEGEASCIVMHLTRPKKPISIPVTVSSVAFSPDSSLLATLSVRGRVSIWEAATGVHFKTFYYPHGRQTSLIIFLSDGDKVAIQEWSASEISIWDITTSTNTATVRLRGCSIAPQIWAVTERRIYTNNGEFGYGAVPPTIATTTSQQVSVHSAYRLGLGISDDWRWILWRDQRIIFLPPSYRPNRPNFGLQILGTKVVMLLPSRRMISLEFSGKHPTLSEA